MAGFRDSFAMQLRQLEKLPMLPQMLWELEAAFQNPMMGAPEIADLIEKDLSLTATLLKVSNSAFFRGGTELVTVRDAVVRLGLDETRRLTRTMLLVDALSVSDTELDYAQFWRHSLLVAVAAAFLQETAFEESPLLPDEAYLAGLLHDIGKLVLDQYFESEYDRVLAFQRENACLAIEAERAVLGVDHGFIGAELLELWGLPPNIVKPVRWHHNLEGATGAWKAAAELIDTANTVCRQRDEQTLTAESLPLPGSRADDLMAALDREEKLLLVITSV